MADREGQLRARTPVWHVIGYALDEPVLILKACIGNRSLGWDLLPPGSKQFEEAWEGRKSRNHFEVLGLERSATASEVKEAYFRLAKRFHPDVHHGAHLGDLRDKLEVDQMPGRIAAFTDVDAEVIAGLTALGYSVVEAQTAVQRLPRDSSLGLEERIRLALRILGG